MATFHATSARPPAPPGGSTPGNQWPAGVASSVPGGGGGGTQSMTTTTLTPSSAGLAGQQDNIPQTTHTAGMQTFTKLIFRCL